MKLESITKIDDGKWEKVKGRTNDVIYFYTNLKERIYDKSNLNKIKKYLVIQNLKKNYDLHTFITEGNYISDIQMDMI